MDIALFGLGKWRGTRSLLEDGVRAPSAHDLDISEIAVQALLRQ
jgi:hypothetical protein